MKKVHNSKLDRKDRKILYELDKNGRATFREISKATRLPEETVRYRYSRLCKDGVIQKTFARVNSTKLGFSYYQVLFKLQNADQKKRDEMLRFLISSKEVNWVASLEGPYDVGAIIVVRHQIALLKLFEEIDLRFGNMIMKRTFSVNLTAEFFNKEYLISKERVPNPRPQYLPQKPPVEITEKEHEICRILSRDGRISVVDLAEELHIGVNTALAKLRSLKNRNIILGYSTIIDHRETGILHYKLLLNINNLSEKKVQKLISFAQLNPNVIATIKVIAEWNYEIDIEVESVAQMKEFTIQLTDRFADILRDYETLQILHMPKYSFYPI